MPWVVFVPVMKRKSKQLKSLSWRIRALLPLIVLVIIFLVAFQGCLFWFETAKQTDVKKQNSEELHRGYALSRTPTPVAPPSCSVPKFRDDGFVDDTVQCRRTAPTASSCKKAKEIYDNVEKVECVGHKEICTLKVGVSL
ncbi:hypothetical protein BSL78_14898 [Apostichopus japonicus]|uniref:Uncharacterized protein n=1 Tax=Stichopus japonicus TaxID=307972 RepID=A0A2G8KJS8_STIJA|nr:hypothetical protein BSL78_14898 [Apostichopus japonicus]